MRRTPAIRGPLAARALLRAGRLPALSRGGLACRRRTGAPLALAMSMSGTGLTRQQLEGLSKEQLVEMLLREAPARAVAEGQASKRHKQAHADGAAGPPLGAEVGAGAEADASAPRRRPGKTMRGGALFNDVAGRKPEGAYAGPAADPNSKRSKKRAKQKEFDMSLYQKQQIALKITYFGQNFHGFADQVGLSSPPSWRTSRPPARLNSRPPDLLISCPAAA